MIARLWRDQQRDTLSHYQELLADGRAFGMHYEDLVTYPRDTLERLCSFLEIEFDERMLSFHNTEQAKTNARSVANWKNLSKPLTSEWSAVTRSRSRPPRSSCLNRSPTDRCAHWATRSNSQFGGASTPRKLPRAFVRVFSCSVASLGESSCREPRSSFAFLGSNCDARWHARSMPT